MSSGQAPVTDFPEASQIDSGDPFLIEVLAPIESETADEAVRRAQDAAAEAVSGVVAEIRGGASAAGDTLGKLEGQIEGRLDRRFLTRAGDPTTADIPAGTIRVAKNTATGRLTLWANDGGTMVDLLIL